MNSPCKDCPKRHMLCHAECNDYALYRREIDRKREVKQREYATETTWNKRK